MSQHNMVYLECTRFFTHMRTMCNECYAGCFVVVLNKAKVVIGQVNEAVNMQKSTIITQDRLNLIQQDIVLH